MKKLKKLILALIIAPLLATLSPVMADQTDLSLSDSNIDVASTVCTALGGSITDINFEYSNKLPRSTMSGQLNNGTIYDICVSDKLIVSFAFEGSTKNSIGELSMAASTDDFKELLPVLFIINTKQEADGLQRDEAVLIEGAKKYGVEYAIIAANTDNTNILSAVTLEKTRLLTTTTVPKVPTPAVALKKAAEELKV